MIAVKLLFFFLYICVFIHNIASIGNSIKKFFRYIKNRSRKTEKETKKSVKVVGAKIEVDEVRNIYIESIKNFAGKWCSGR